MDDYTNIVGASFAVLCSAVMLLGGQLYIEYQSNRFDLQRVHPPTAGKSARRLVLSSGSPVSDRKTVDRPDEVSHSRS